MDFSLRVGGSFLSPFVEALRDRIFQLPTWITQQFLNLFQEQNYDGRRILEKLDSKLLMLQVVLEDAENKRSKNRAVKRWLDDLQEVLYQAEDVLDQMNTEALRVKAESKFQTRKRKGWKLNTEAEPISGLVMFEDGIQGLTLIDLEGNRPGGWLYSSVVDAYGHMLNRIQFVSGAGAVKRFCFATTIAGLTEMDMEKGATPLESEMVAVVDMWLRDVSYLAPSYKASLEQCHLFFLPVRRAEYFYVYAVDLPGKKFLCLNSKECLLVFDDVHRPLGDLVLRYFIAWHRNNFGAVLDFGAFSWGVPNVPIQPDGASCGLFTAWMIETWNGHIPQDCFALWVREDYIALGRRRMVSRILCQKENDVLEERMREVKAWKQSITDQLKGHKGKTGNVVSSKGRRGK